jgi:exopolyphosphatase/guanosine-5'-triphosphate,3'-diphosphate pyrophosphatase
LVAAIRAQCGLEVEVLSGEQEARLAFAGAAQTLDHLPSGELGVVDVGGGSSELVVGQAPDRVAWSTSVALGSADLSSSFLYSDPPTRDELAQARAHVAQAFAELVPPHPSEAVAVGGSAASLSRLAGPLLDAGTFKRCLTLLGNVRASEVAHRFALDIERVRLLAGGLLILQAASERFGSALVIGRGGLREGVLLEAAHA